MVSTLLGLAGLAACAPTFEDPRGLVEGPRVLAVRGSPAEVRTSESFELEALVGSPDGPLDDPVRWAYCTEPRTVEERTAVTAACLEGESLEPIAALTVMPIDACARFGPNPPPVKGDEPPRRPADPDPSGGYFLPVRASTDAAVTFGFQRIRCDLAGATRAIFDAFEDQYEANEHPTVAIDVPEVLGPGDRATLEARAAPEDAEPYVVYVAEDSALVDRIEELTASFYVTAGALSESRIRLADDRATTRFTAPEEPGRVHGWVVVVDDRGGVGWEAFTIVVER